MSGQEYSTDADGSRPVTLRYRYAGTMTVADFLEFTAERARWLDVSGWVAASGDNAVTMVAAGPEAMVGALEMACTLGPLNAVITDIEVREEHGPVAAGFAIRRWGMPIPQPSSISPPRGWCGARASAGVAGTTADKNRGNPPRPPQ